MDAGFLLDCEMFDEGHGCNVRISILHLNYVVSEVCGRAEEIREGIYALPREFQTHSISWPFTETWKWREWNRSHIAKEFMGGLEDRGRGMSLRPQMTTRSMWSESQCEERLEMRSLSYNKAPTETADSWFWSKFLLNMWPQERKQLFPGLCGCTPQLQGVSSHLRVPSWYPPLTPPAPQPQELSEQFSSPRFSL